MLKRTSVGGLEIAYDDVGADDRPFVMVHGFTGSRDDFAEFLEPSREMAKAIPDAESVVIKAAHHSPQIEARSAWFSAIQTHLERVRA